MLLWSARVFGLTIKTSSLFVTTSVIQSKVRTNMNEKTIKTEVTQDCLDALVVQELREMRECLVERMDIEAFAIVIKYYEEIEGHI